MSKARDWNNQVRAANAALALKAHRKAKGEEGLDEADISDLISDLLHLYCLVTGCCIEDIVESAGNNAIHEEEDEKQAGIVYYEMPEGGMEELLEWIDETGIQSRELMEKVPV